MLGCIEAPYKKFNSRSAGYPNAEVPETPELRNILTQRAHIHYYYGIIGPQNHNGDGLLGPNSIIVVYMGPLGQP